MPVPLIVGETEILGVPIQVSRSVIVPTRGSEMMASVLIHLIRREGLHRGIMVDMGTGSGVLAISAAIRFPSLTVYATDISKRALKVAARNVSRLGLTNVTLLHGDMFKPLIERQIVGCVDVVVSNPPYVRTSDLPHMLPQVRYYAPRIAVDGGPDGLSLVRRVIHGAPRCLRRGGYLILKHGAGQIEDVHELVCCDGRYEVVGIVFDETGMRGILVASLIFSA